MANKSEQLARIEIVYPQMGRAGVFRLARAWRTFAKRAVGRWIALGRNVRAEAASREQRLARAVRRARASCRGQLIIVVRPWRWSKKILIVAAVSIALVYPVFMSAHSHNVPLQQLSSRSRSVRTVYGVLANRVVGTNPAEALAVAEAIVDESSNFGFDPLFIVAVIEAESRYEVEAVSRSGARGLMQVLPSTFKSFSTATRMMDPVENVRTGIRILGYLSKSFKNPDSLLLAYNAGPGGARDIINGDREHTNETGAYAPNVMSKYSRLLKEHGRDPRQAKKTYITPVKVVK